MFVSCRVDVRDDVLAVCVSVCAGVLIDLCTCSIIDKIIAMIGDIERSPSHTQGGRHGAVGPARAIQIMVKKHDDLDCALLCDYCVTTPATSD